MPNLKKKWTTQTKWIWQVGRRFIFWIILAWEWIVFSVLLVYKLRGVPQQERERSSPKKEVIPYTIIRLSYLSSVFEILQRDHFPEVQLLGGTWGFFAVLYLSISVWTFWGAKPLISGRFKLEYWQTYSGYNFLQSWKCILESISNTSSLLKIAWINRLEELYMTQVEAKKSDLVNH